MCSVDWVFGDSKINLLFFVSKPNKIQIHPTLNNISKIILVLTYSLPLKRKTTRSIILYIKKRKIKIVNI